MLALLVPPLLALTPRRWRARLLAGRGRGRGGADRRAGRGQRRAHPAAQGRAPVGLPARRRGQGGAAVRRRAAAAGAPRARRLRLDAGVRIQPRAAAAGGQLRRRGVRRRAGAGADRAGPARHRRAFHAGARRCQFHRGADRTASSARASARSRSTAACSSLGNGTRHPARGEPRRLCRALRPRPPPHPDPARRRQRAARRGPAGPGGQGRQARQGRLRDPLPPRPGDRARPERGRPRRGARAARRQLLAVPPRPDRRRGDAGDRGKPVGRWPGPPAAGPATGDPGAGLARRRQLLPGCSRRWDELKHDRRGHPAGAAFGVRQGRAGRARRHARRARASSWSRPAAPPGRCAKPGSTVRDVPT